MVRRVSVDKDMATHASTEEEEEEKKKKEHGEEEKEEEEEEEGLPLTREQLNRQWLHWARDKPTANRWHDRRRAALVREHPEVLSLVGPSVWTPLAAIGISGLHYTIASQLAPRSWAHTIALATTVGALAAFDLQAIIHELFHQRAPRHQQQQQQQQQHYLYSIDTAATWTTASWLNALVRNTICSRIVSHTCGLVASSLTTVPWYTYYFAGGHEQHHQHAGTPFDIDGDALFFAWEGIPAPLRERLPLLDTRVGAVLWLTVVATALPAVYFASLLACFVASPALNARELVTAGVDTALTVAVYTAAHASGGGLRSVVYLGLSTALSMGCLGHPLLAFWVAQHACVDTSDLIPSSLPVPPPYLLRHASSPNDNSKSRKKSQLVDEEEEQEEEEAEEEEKESIEEGEKKEDKRQKGAAYDEATACPGTRKGPELPFSYPLGQPFYCDVSYQPTLSYYGSTLWNWLTLNELLHVEHHDLSGVPWTRLHKLRQIAPEFYTGPRVASLHSIYGDIMGPWLSATGRRMEFACRRRVIANIKEAYAMYGYELGSR